MLPRYLANPCTGVLIGALLIGGLLLSSCQYVCPPAAPVETKVGGEPVGTKAGGEPVEAKLARPHFVTKSGEALPERFALSGGRLDLQWVPGQMMEDKIDKWQVSVYDEKRNPIPDCSTGWVKLDKRSLTCKPSPPGELIAEIDYRLKPEPVKEGLKLLTDYRTVSYYVDSQGASESKGPRL